MKFKRGNTLMFLDPLNTHLREYDKEKKVIVILSPSLYWVQKLSLPVKYVREVKKLLPSIFEDILPQGDYSYNAYKSGEDFFVFAYEDKRILELLHQNGIHIADIKSIHFAQSEFLGLEKAIQINETQSLYIQNEILGLAPTVWFENPDTLDLQGMEPSKHTIKIQQYGHLVKSSSLYKIAGLLSALILILFVESFITSQKINDINEAKDKLFSKYKLQSTMMQNKSLQKKYKKIYIKQSKLREYISYFLSMPLSQKQRITLMDYKNSVLIVHIIGVQRGSETNILNILKKKRVQVQTSFHKETLVLEMKL